MVLSVGLNVSRTMYSGPRGPSDVVETGARHGCTFDVSHTLGPLLLTLTPPTCSQRVAAGADVSVFVLAKQVK